MKLILACAVFLVASTGWGQTLPGGARLAQEKQCMQCHSIEKDTTGPSFQKIGAIYRTMKNPEAKLIEVMRLGSDAHLGPLSGRARMPDNSERPPISDEEARQLARWILS